MDKPINIINIFSLLLEGGNMALALQLIVVNLSPSNGHRWQIRLLKIIMAIGLFTKSLLFSSFNLSTKVKECQIAGRVGNGFYHIGRIAAMIILLLRVMAIIPDKYYILFIIIHSFFMVIKLGFSTLDIISTDISVNSYGVCVVKEKYKLVAADTIFNCFIDVYVSVMVIIILSNHIRRVRPLGISGNVNLYVSVVLANVTRTVILTAVCVFYATFILTSIYNPVSIYIIWPLNSITIIVLVGYDTNITNAYRKIQSISHPDDETRPEHAVLRNSFTRNRSSARSMSKNSNTRRVSSFFNDEEDQDNVFNFNSLDSGSQQGYSRQGDTSAPFTDLEMIKRDTDHFRNNSNPIDSPKTL